MMVVSAFAVLVGLLEPLHSQPQTSRPEPAGPAAAVGWLVLIVSVLSVWLIIAARRRARRTGRPQGMRSMPGGGAVGNALFDLGSVLQPDRPDAAVIARLEEEDERDDLGDGRR